MTVQILKGNCRDVLRTLPDESVHCVVTSPPYWGLRDYGVAGQIGLEGSPDAFVAELVAVFGELRRVLRADGTAWLNLGDCYGGDSGTQSKQLMGIPWRVAFALQADGWWLRQDIIWSKPNPMPESVTDRCTKAHEYLFMLAKSERYFYDASAIAEDAIYAGLTGQDESGGNPVRGEKPDKRRGHGRRHDGFNDRWDKMEKSEQCSGKRNKRSVWTVATSPFAEAHFATFPPALIEPCILAGCPKECCAKCGGSWVRKTETTKETSDRPARGKALTSPRHDGNPWNENGGRGFMPIQSKTLGWSPSCACNAGIAPGVCLDPFGGAGTTGLVADRLGRNAILIELNPEYAAMAERRISGDGGMFASVEVSHGT